MEIWLWACIGIMAMIIIALFVKICILQKAAWGLNIGYFPTHRQMYLQSSHVSQLTAALTKQDCEMISMQEHDEGLESYYIALVGGGKNA